MYRLIHQLYIIQAIVDKLSRKIFFMEGEQYICFLNTLSSRFTSWRTCAGLLLLCSYIVQTQRRVWHRSHKQRYLLKLRNRKYGRKKICVSLSLSFSLSLSLSLSLSFFRQTIFHFLPSIRFYHQYSFEMRKRVSLSDSSAIEKIGTSIMKRNMILSFLHVSRKQKI